MICEPLAKRMFVRFAILFLALELAPSLSHAQQDFQIMVNGPWQFVSANGRLFLVAPYHETHTADIWPGPDAAMDYWQDLEEQQSLDLKPIIPSGGGQPNLYTLDFTSGTRQKLTPPDEENSLVYPTDPKEVSAATIKSVLDATILVGGQSVQRYAISLPIPDFAQTYNGGWMPGVAEVKISPANYTNTAPTRSSPWSSQTTWTVLHYGFQQGQAATQMNLTLNGTSKPIPGTSSSSRFGISIGLMGAPLCPSNGYFPSCSWPYNATWPSLGECDTFSSLSFALATSMWGLNEASRFPIERDDVGNQETGNYDYTCLPGSTFNLAALNQQVNHLQSLRRLLSSLASGSPQTRSAQETIEQTFSEMKSDLNVIFNGHIPENVADDFNCACKVSNKRSDACQLGFTSKKACLAGISVKALVDDLFTNNDKGVSDCHAPQIGIDGPIPTN